MNKTLMGAVLVAAMMVGFLAMPAAALAPAPPDVGIIQGNANVGKIQETECTKTGGGAVRGGGLGFPIVSDAKNAFYQLVSANVVAASKPGLIGVLNICGDLEPTLSAVGTVPGQTEPGIGAACGLSKGHSGTGFVSFEGVITVYLNNVGWKNSAGGLLPVLGEAAQTAVKGIDKDGNSGSTIVAPTIAQGGAGCVSKVQGGSDEDKGGATSFVTTAVFTILPTPYSLVDPNQYPGTCKDGMDDLCLYEPKKP